MLGCSLLRMPNPVGPKVIERPHDLRRHANAAPARRGGAARIGSDWQGLLLLFSSWIYTNPTASISMSHSGLSKEATTTAALAGYGSLNTSPRTRATAG